MGAQAACLHTSCEHSHTPHLRQAGCLRSELMLEMPNAGEDHGEAVLIGGGYHLRIAH